MPIVSDDVSVNWRGSSGKTPVVSAIATSRNAVNTRLRDEQPRDALDVAQDLAALVDHPRHLAELAADQHEVGDRARHLRPAALRDREPRLLERRHVVDAVAEHADVLAALREHAHDARLVLGRDPPDRGRRAHRLEQRGVGLGQRCGRRARRLRAGMPASRAIAPTVAGLSPETTFSATSSAAKNATVASALSRSRSARTTIPSGRSGSGSGASGAGGGQRRVRGRRARARGARRDASSDAPLAQRAVARRAAPRARRARAGRRRARARSSAGARRTAPGRSGSAAASPSARPAAWTASSVELRDGALAAKRPSARASRGSSTPSAGTSATTRSDASVSVPVLSVHMTDTDASDSIALSCCASTPRRAIFAADTAAVSETSRISPSGTMFTTAAVSVSTACAWPTSRIASETPSATAERHHHPDEDDQQPVHRLLERRARMAERARGRREPGGAAVGADRRRLEARRRPRRRTSPESTSSPARAQHRLALAGQVRLVEREAVALQQRAVGDDLVAAGDAARGRPRPPRRSATARAARRRGRPWRSARRARRACRARASRGPPGTSRSPMFANRMPRKSASRGFPKAIVAAPKTARIRLKIVNVFAIAIER